MEKEKPNSFKRMFESPVWEGVIFPGLEREDPRTLVYAAEVHPDLRPFIEAIWFMIWDIPEGTELSGIGAPIPCVKLIANNFPGFPQPVHSLYKTKDTGVLLKFKGSGQAVGVDFKPGGLFPFTGKPLEGERGVLSADEVLSSLPLLPKGSWDLKFAESWVAKTQDLFRQKLQQLHPHHLGEITPIIEKILNDRNTTQVEDLLLDSNTSKRSLQRIFKNEVGMSIKDVSRIARFNRTIRELNGASIENFAQFALESGYFDQPHMVNDFKKLVAESPKIFRKYW